MKTFNINSYNDRFVLGNKEFYLPRGEAVSLDEILVDLNRQAGDFWRFYEVAGGGVGYSHLDRDVAVIRGRVEL